MSKERATIGTDGLPLPVLPPERDPRVWARLVRIMFYLPGFMALLLIKAGEAASFGITVELLMLSSAAAIIGGLYVGSDSSGAGADSSSKTGVWSGALVLELLAVVPFLCALPSLFYELSHSTLLHSKETPTQSPLRRVVRGSAAPRFCRWSRSCRSCSINWLASAPCTSSCRRS